MNPDPNQPQDPAQTPSPEVTPAVTPTPTEPVAAPNPFGASTPVSSETPAAAPLGSAQPGTIGSAPAGAPLPGSTQNSKKKLIILISAIVGGLLIAGGIAIALYLMFFSVSKADYKQAYDQLKTVQTSVSATSITGDSDELTTTYNTFKTENAKLGDLKALKADKELNEKYKAYDTKAKAYITFMDGFIPSFQKLKTATDTMSGGSNSPLKSASVQATITALEDATTATDPSVKAYAEAVLAAYKEILPQAKIYETSTVSSARLAAVTAISKSTRGLSTASTDFSKDIKERYEGSSPKETFEALSKAVADKYNKK